MKQFAIQHYTFRPLSNEIGFFPMLDKVAEMGYNEMEACFFSGFSATGFQAKELRRKLADLGMTYIGNHFTRALFDGPYQETFDFIAEAGGKYVIYNSWHPHHTMEDVTDTTGFLNTLVPYAKCGSLCGAAAGYLQYLSGSHGTLQLIQRLQLSAPCRCRGAVSSFSL